jgi:MFS family permease
MNMLVLFRVFLGFSGGPLMPLSQTLMMRIFPRNKGHVAIGIWSMTTLVAPIMGPILAVSFATSLAGTTSLSARRRSPSWRG